MALPSADKIKIWLFPSLISILGLLIWTDLQTIKTTLATAVIQTTTDKANILNLESRVNKLESAVFKQVRVAKSVQEPPSKPVKDESPLFTKIVATKPDEEKYTLQNKVKLTL
jgi:hypothetical protein